MNESVQIINKNGDAMYAEAIAYIQLSTNNKKYLFYTLDEKVDNDLTKIYIAEASDTPGELNPISDDEWNDLRTKMVKMSHKEEVQEATYLNMNVSNFYVGEAKKLAITSVAKQTFKDAQSSHTMIGDQSETPVVTGESTFIAQEPAPVAEPVAAQESIFANPPQPVVENVEVPSQEAVQAPTEAVPAQVAAPIDAVMQTAPVVNETAPIAPAPAVETPVVEAPVVETQEQAPAAVTVEEPAKVTEIPTTDTTQKVVISDEDALKAINIIQDYIAQEEAA